MPAFAGPLIGFALGALLARWGRGARGVRGALPLFAFGAIVHAPACAYPLLFFPDWAFAYLFDARGVPSAITLALVLIDAAAPAAGFLLARRALAKEALGEDPTALAVALSLAILPAGAAVLASVALGPRLAIEGTYAMVHGAFGVAPLWKSPLGYALVWMAACIGAGAWLTGRTLAAAARTAAELVPAPVEDAAPKPYLGAHRPNAKTAARAVANVTSMTSADAKSATRKIDAAQPRGRLTDPRSSARLRENEHLGAHGTGSREAPRDRK
ncbi:MAG: hypothetical protein U0441_24470 [Polyangiaceae bacterium]